jgi:CRISPR system Cascade subunit CasA
MSGDALEYLPAVLGETPFTLDAGEEPTEELLSELLGSTVRVTPAKGLPAKVVTVFENALVPPAFRASPWLAASRAAIVGDDGTGHLGNLPVRYTHDQGLQILYPEAGLGPDDDDDDWEVQLVSFDLIEEPWLPVVSLDGRPDAVGLATLLHNAHTIRGIIGQTPPMTAALYRLVLALAHRVYGPSTLARWEELWSDERLPTDELPKYLSEHPRRFDLFDQDRPFLQCPAVATASPSSAAKLVPYRSVGNNTTLFDHTTSRDEVTLTPAEAARWLVTLQAYDPGGLKTPHTKVKSSQAAPANWFGVVLLEGRDLKQTLLLNLMSYNLDDEQPPNTSLADRPAWEGNPPPPEPDERRPAGWTDLLTWPSRRVWLGHRQIGDETVVDRVVITPGTRLKAEPEENEWMAAYRRLELKKGRRAKCKEDTPAYGPWYPIRLQEHRGVWRHSQELFLAPEARKERRCRQRPAALDHVANMVGREAIPSNTVYTLRVFGQQLDSKFSVVHQSLEETVAAPVALLKAEHKAAGPVIGYSVILVSLVGSALNQMERGYCKEFGREVVSSLELAYWPRLSEPFNRFLRALAKALESGAPLASDWAKDVRRIARGAADRWAEGSPRQGRNLAAAAAHHGKFIGQLNQYIDAYHGHLAGYIEESS